MRLIKNFALTFLAGAILAVLAILVSPRTASANHGVCPPSGWGINSGNPSHPAGLVVKTVDEGNNPINGITWRINADSASIVLSDASGNIYSNVSSRTFTTGETIWCGSPTDNYSGVTVLGFGSTRSYGNHWVLWCQRWGTSNPAGYSIDNVASPAGRTGYWTGNPGNFRVTNGATTWITLTWHDTGKIQGYKVLPGNNPSEPAASQNVNLAGYGGTTANPYFFLNLPAGGYTVGVAVPAGYSVGYTLCYNDTSCHNNSPTPGDTVTVNVPAGGFVDLWWHYNQLPVGYIDTVNCSLIGGWARDPDTDNAIAVHIYSDLGTANQRFVGAVTAGGFRPDVGNHAYGLSPPDFLKDGNTHRIAVAAIDSSDSNQHTWLPSSGTSLDLNCSPPPPPPTCTITAAPRSINLGDSSTISWAFGASAVSGKLYERIGDVQTLLQDNIPKTGSRIVNPTVNTTYVVRVTNSIGQTGQCSTAVEILIPSPVPTPTPPPPASPPPPPPPPPPPETLTLIPNQCENAVETDKLTDNYITKPGTYDSPIEAGGIQLTGTFNQEVTIPLNVKFTVDFSKLQSLFGYPNSDYLEGRFQQASHRAENILELGSADFNNFHGAAQKAEPKYLTDLEKVKYVHYVYNKPEIAESPNKYTNIAGLEPKTVKELVDLYGLPVPPSGEDGRGFWLVTWGAYWPKIPTAYNELYLGKLEFAVVGSEKSFEDLKNGSGCASASARTVEFIVPDFGRTTLVADQLNQVIVPYAAQSFRDHRTQDQGVGLGPPKNFLAKAVDFCKKIITAPVNLVKSLQKVVKVTLNFLSPVKTVYAQDTDDGPTCLKILRPGKEGNAPYCAVPPDQLQPGDSCANKITPNKLNPDNPNVVCTFQIGSFTTTINPANPFWDECVNNGDGTYTCRVDKIRVYPNFRLPWIAEIWNSTLYSDANEAGLGSVQGAKTDEGGQVLQSQTSTGIGSPQVTGRPGLYSAFIPKVLYQKFQEDNSYAELERLFAACPRFFGPIPDPTAPPDDQAACDKLTTSYNACINENLNIGIGTPEFIQAVVNCVADRVSRHLSGQTADGSVQGVSTEGGGQVLASTTESNAKERFVGAVDCGKHYARDVALKPKALQTYLGIGVTCNLEAAAIPAIEIPPGGGGTPPPTDCTPATDGNPLNGIETTPDELVCYIAEQAAGKIEPKTGLPLAEVMTRVMFAESGGKQCSVGLDDEIGVFQFIAATWKGMGVPDGVDSGSGTLAQYDAGKTVCWGLPGGDPNLNTADKLRSWPINFGQNKDGDAWNPYRQVDKTIIKMVDHNDVCAWSTVDYIDPNTGERKGLYPFLCPR